MILMRGRTSIQILDCFVMFCRSLHQYHTCPHMIPHGLAIVFVHLVVVILVVNQAQLNQREQLKHAELLIRKSRSCRYQHPPLMPILMTEKEPKVQDLQTVRDSRHSD